MKKFGRKRSSIHGTICEDARRAFDDIRRKIADSGRLSSSDFSIDASPGNTSQRRDHPCDLASSSSDDSENWSSFTSVHSIELRAGHRRESLTLENKGEGNSVVNHDILSSSETYDESLGFESFLDSETRRTCRIQNITFRKKKETDGLVGGQSQGTESLQSSYGGMPEVGALRKVPFDRMPKNVKKIGEATFSEVFAHGPLVYKIVPLGDTPDETSLSSFLRESIIFRTISGEDGVCGLKDVFLVAGRYPEEYLKAWDDYGEEENERPCKYRDEQEYGVIVMEDGGESLESIKFQKIAEVDAFIRSAVRVLANLEKKYEFEHRDLHWGNILIREGQINLIDFSLSRLRSGGAVIFNDLNSKQWLFEGDEAVDIQFRVYRDMRKLCSGCWSRFVPASNVLWLRYLVEKAFSKNRFRGRKTLISQYISVIDSSTSAADVDRKLEMEVGTIKKSF
ncbi:similarity to DNA DAMAGE-RESPONSE PROTEIN [Encephalitozoon cuniculi GB-M1]|uniref:non-specific serine/threonine protein kinase n=2 Tax=Encephalitozoon cuniculi TaxID=6035 RepID=Q8SW35_ENCCU|nr:uncharacterized protein ECU03_0890 [Encephalitozoon cuniculi GB-M1]CAD26233.2 similarity to DNA DAMAGE-RESPONSE PROTEIN [Encephalitozoon cuniculi GB-M1]